MLTQLYIRNYAIIDEIEIQFREGLTIITGETGAGKSILMGALSLILGDRADSQSFFKQNEKCILEGRFLISHLPKVKQYLHENDFEGDDELIIRRELSPQGRSRVFINDTPSTLSVLQPLTSTLIDMHRQFDTIELQQSQFQLDLLDELAKHHELLSSYQLNFQQWKNVQQTLLQLQSTNLQIKQELDYHQFLYNELEAIQLQENELEELESRLAILSNSESLKADMEKALWVLQNEEEPVSVKLKSAIQTLESHAKKIVLLEPLLQRLQSALIEVKDISYELESFFETTHVDQAELEKVSDRLNEGNRLLKKHHAQSTAELLALQQDLSTRIHQAVNADEEEQKLRGEIDAAFTVLQTQAAELHQHRFQLIPSIEENVNALLQKVGMPNARMKISMSEIDFNFYGNDKVEFLFDANKTGKFQPIAKVASGGELSRLMLCIKSVLADSTQMPTLVFDEIDTGISGETAIQVGNIMQTLSKKHQLICITHLPQIASKAKAHLFIYKQENAEGQIHTRLKELSEDERIDVLAEMLSGKDSGEQAKDMVKNLMR